MDPLSLGLISCLVLMVLILSGFHIAIALSFTSFATLYLLTGRLSVAAKMLETTSYSALMDYVFAVIPLFVLMGLLTTASGATGELFQVAEKMTRRLPGGVGVSTVLANMIFAAITGVSVASAAVFSKVAVPEMVRLNYDRKLSLGIVASSALLGMLIPPSVLMIIYGILTEQSVGRLFAAGIGPGLLLSLALCLYIVARVLLRPETGGRSAALREKARHAPQVSLLRPWPIYLLIFVILGGIYGGVMTPTEAGAVGAAGGLAMLFARGRQPGRAFLNVVLDTGSATASIFALLVAAQMYSRMLTLTGLPAAATDWVAALPVPPIFVILLLVVILLLLGMFLDSVSILLLTMPIIHPVILHLGYDPIWFGIVAIFAVEIGLLTPPFGMVIFAMKAALPDDVAIGEIYAGTMPFILLLFGVLALLIAMPSFTLWLPNYLYN